MAKVTPLIWLFPLFCTLLVPIASGQYIQDWSFGPDGNGNPAYWWRPNLNAQFGRIWEWDNIGVFLVYNCYYMTAICQNAQNFLNSPRGLARQPHQTMFAYDFGRRTTARRQRSCPSTWAASHLCPEINQPTVWRQDKAWYYTDLDPVQVPNNVIRHLRDTNGNVVEPSYLRYTCDEFPPATWVEGGSGAANLLQPAETRCAGYRCPGTAGMKIYGEQNWQARAHTALQGTLRNLVANQLGPGVWNTASEPVAFWLHLDNQPNGIPAQIITATGNGQVLNTQNIPPSKRSEMESMVNMTMQERMAWMGSLGPYGLQKYGFQLSSHNIHVNESFSAVENPWFDDFDWRNNVTDPIVDVDWTSGLAEPLVPKKRAAERQVVPKNSTDNLSIRRRDATTTEPETTPLIKNATAADIAAARKLVDAAITASGDLNRARFSNMARNHYSLMPGTKIGDSTVKNRRSRHDDGSAPPPLLEVTPELAAAAALVAEADALGVDGNSTLTNDGTNSTTVTNGTTLRAANKNAVVLDSVTAAAVGSFWMETIERKGTVPWGDDPSYKVFRNVRDYGAVGDGVTDDTKAIKNAMSDGNRCGKNCNGSTTKNAVVYFPPGKYLVSSGISVYFGTQLIGDANNWPTIVASKSFIGTSVLSTDEYTGGGTGPDGGDQEWYVNTASFYRQIRNFRIDVTATRSAQEVACIHYQVAQATSLQFVELIAKTGTKQRGIVAENGSGGVLADITFTGGNYGLWGGEQQFTAQRLTFNGCSTAVQVIWDWGWVWKSITVNNADVGFRLLPEDGSTTGNIGSATFMDSTFNSVGTAVLVAPLDSAPGSGSTNVVIDNVAFSNVQQAVADTSGATLLAASDKVDLWVTGPVYSTDREFYMGKAPPTYTREKSLLDSDGAYFERAKPQYEDHSVDDFVHLKDLGAAGDGVTDDTAAVQSALNGNVGKIIFVDAGTYILTGTVTIPPGTKLVGETWSQFAASGAYFSDASSPKVMLQVGVIGSTGDVEMQDLLFTTKGQTPGAILVEWNIKASSPGSAGLWDCHARIGGATGTELTPAECPAVTSGIDPNCQGASMMMHLTKQASGYFENMWLWVADHIIDDPLLDDAANGMEMISIYVARGFLIESTTATWLYGTASEHSVYYQYNFNDAKNIFAGFIQTESPYYQPTPEPPQPFEGVVGKFPGDPTYTCGGGDFDGCDSSWAVMIRGCENIFIASAGLYSWFSTYSQDCIDGHTCQNALMLLENNSGSLRIQNLVTIGAKYSLVQDGKGVLATDYLNVDSHPSWSIITLFDSTNNEIIWIDPTIWNLPTPTVWCQPPCILKLPPWTGATSTYDYPIITASGDGWTTKVTRAPITATAWFIEPVTIDASGRQQKRGQPIEQELGDDLAARQADEAVGSIWATFMPTPVWPTMAFRGGDDQVTTTQPSSPTHPAPPPPAGPTPPPQPPSGNWPNAVVVARGVASPQIGVCTYDDPSCNPDFWNNGGNWQPVFTGGDGDEDPDEQNPEDEGVYCPITSSTSTTTTTKPTPTTTKEPIPVPSPMENTLSCYNSGAKADHVQVDNAINSFCGQLEKVGVLGSGFYYKWGAAFDVSNNQAITVDMSVEVNDNCEWAFVSGDCRHYLDVPLDSCNCGGVNSKQGGIVKNNCITWRMDPNCQSGSICI